MGENAIGVAHECRLSAARGGHYIACRIPAKISCVNPSNCARAHILAWQKREAASGKAFFIRDFDANVVDMNINAFAKTPIKPVLLPLWLAWVLALLQDRIYRVLHFLRLSWLLSF